MSTQDHYDYIIAGAGAAGLSLTRAILSSSILRSKRILLIDQHLKPATDKTWSFWAQPDNPVTELAFQHWQDITVSAYTHDFSTVLDKLRYYCIKSEEFSSRILKEVKESPQVTTLKASVSEITSDDSMVTVLTDKGVYTGTWCFQSVFKSPLNRDKEQHEIRLLQHFMGWEIEVQEPFFHENEVMLMDFDIPQGDGVTFFYVLPFSSTHALVEYTMFSPQMLSSETYEEEIRHYLKDKFNLSDGDFSVTRKEIGAIPMESVRYSPWLNPRTLNIGMIGGHTKPSTGYTFMRIQKQVESIVQSLQRDEKPGHAGTSSYRFRVYDIMLLSILDKNPLMGVKIFHDLFKKNSMELVFKFLDEKTHLLEELKIFSTLPYLPFLKSIYQMRSRIFSGA